MSSSSSSFRQLWLRWKALRLPWRRQWLAGVDLSGNTYWEFKDAIRAGRLRRIVRSRSSRTHNSDVQVTPQWMQWLRHTRADPPSVAEQQLDLVRQAQLKELAAEADRRWEEKASLLGVPSPALAGTAAPTAADATQRRGRTELSPRERDLVRELRRDNLPAGQSGASSPAVPEQDVQERDTGGVNTRTGREGSEALIKQWRGHTFTAQQEPQPETWAPSVTRRR